MTPPSTTPVTSDGSRLAGRRAIVTGGGRGIGAEIAATFRRHGAEVITVDLSADGEHQLAADLADPAQARAVIDTAIERLGGVDILVNNAGILQMAPLLELDVETWDRTFDVNVRAMLLTMQQAAPPMIDQGSGSIINMASMGGKVGSPNQAHYAASKAAVIALTRVAAMELGPHQIRVNCLCPGYVLTEMGAATRTQAMIDTWSAKSPLGRLAQPSDVAAMALFLAADESSYYTGQAMNVTGGMIMH